MTAEISTPVQAEPLAAEQRPPLRPDDPSTDGSRGWEHAKRLVDVLLATVALVVLSPLLALLAVAVMLDTPGPALFSQRRHGRGLRTFMVLKFRTMHDGASPELHRSYIADLARAGGDDGPGLKKLTADPRVTRVGRLLRASSLDELPQLVNVLRGDMSIVGPRPALPYELDHYRPEDFARFEVRPGLTGLWQVSGRNSVSFFDMLSLDAQYARISSPRIDAVILLRTPLALVRGNAA